MTKAGSSRLAKPRGCAKFIEDEERLAMITCSTGFLRGRQLGPAPSLRDLNRKIATLIEFTPPS